MRFIISTETLDSVPKVEGYGTYTTASCSLVRGVLYA